MLRGLLQRLFVGPWQSTILSEGGGSPLPFVSASNALRYSAVYRAVSLIANDVARIPVTVSASGADSLLRSPSPYMSAFEFRRAMTMQVLLWGNAFAAINRSRGGELLELILLEPDSVSLDTQGTPFYRTRLYGDLPLDQVFHLKAPNTNGLWGDSPINLCRVSLQLMAAQEDFALKAYSNAGNPKIALVHPGPLSIEARQRIAADYEAKHSGTANAGRPVVLAEGMRVERISSTLDDAGLQQARQYSVNDVSRIYGVPVSYLSESGGPSYGTLEWLSRMYVDACLRAWLECWNAAIRERLATPFDSVSFDTDALVKPGMAETMAALRTGVEAGFITRNEARAQLDLEPLPGLDDPIIALNMGTGGGQSNIGNDTSESAGTPNDF